MKAILTIAGSDSSGGAGIQANIKTMTTHGVYAMSAITALTTQNTTGVTGIMEVIPFFSKEQLDDMFTGIFPDTVKIEMISSDSLIETIGDKLAFYRATNVVVDSVMVSTNGSRLISGEAIEALKEVLLPMANLLAPNIPEAEMLSGMEIYNPGDIERVAGAIGKSHGCAVLLRSGHQLNNANDLLYQHRGLKWFNGRRVGNPNIHGTGYTLSSAITSNLAKGMDIGLAVERVRVYLPGALEAQLDLEKGSGPMNHGSVTRGEY